MIFGSNLARAAATRLHGLHGVQVLAKLAQHTSGGAPLLALLEAARAVAPPAQTDQPQPPQRTDVPRSAPTPVSDPNEPAGLREQVCLLLLPQHSALSKPLSASCRCQSCLLAATMQPCPEGFERIWVMQVAVLFDQWAAISEEQPSEKVHAPFVSLLQQSGFLKVNLP